MQQSAQSNIIFKKEIIMTNRNEYRLHQIEILLNTYRKENPEFYKDEITALETERTSILLDIKFKE